MLLLACHAPDDRTQDPLGDTPASDSAGEDSPPGDSAGKDSAGESGPDPDRAYTLAPSAAAQHGAFATAAACSECHQTEAGDPAMRDAAGRPVAAHDLWRSSMMAHAARDPFWIAAVSFEAEPWGRVEDEIRTECLPCHAPTVAAELPAFEVLYGTDAQALVALDGVTCTACHQLGSEGLTTTVDGALPLDEGAVAYGPFADPVPGEMPGATGYTPVQGRHLETADACAPCHVVEPRGRNGVGDRTSRRYPEQMTWREWAASGVTTTCQGCHLPVVDDDGRPIETEIARDATVTLSPRAPVGRHHLAGANTHVLSLLRDNAETLGVLATPAELDASVTFTRGFLQGAASLAFGTPVLGEIVDVPVRIQNLTGHKLPTGFPSRRMWLEATVTDATGAVLLQTGAFDAEGRLLDAHGAVRPEERAKGPSHPHRDVVSPGEVQVWEHVLGDDQGYATALLLLAVRPLKDDRLLPAGFDSADSDLLPVGTGGDTNFAAGADEVHLQFPAGTPPYEVRAALRYQALGGRHLAEMFEVDTPEITTFHAMWAESDRTPEVLASAGLTVR